ncbi:MAG: trypsin-like peptidase domain-containing protein [Oscillospiraceae bacterium]|nr:trypsin-like peptidase domain-containing protein [Oscillospiraceae bacterium]
MEQEFNAWNGNSQEISTKPLSPFADSPYESPFTVQAAAPKIAPKKSTGKFFKRLLCVILIMALVAGSCAATALALNAYWSNEFELMYRSMENKLNVYQNRLDAALSSMGSGSSPNPSNIQTPGMVYAKNVNAVVAISNQSIVTNIYGQISETASSGSGFIVTQDGYVVSNYHVIAGATKLSVIMADSTEYEAKVVGYDAASDLSVLKINATGLPYVQLGSSDALAVGDQVSAIGNPLGELTSTLTVGYISAKDRLVNTDGSYINMLQTDAAINSGNSGGPLFNMKGEVVGITTAKYSGTSNSGATIEGIGFAIPIDDVAGMIEDLVKDGFINGAYLGVTVEDMNPEVAQAYGLPIGVYVRSVVAGSAADKSGIRAKDIIVAVGDQNVTSLNELTRVLRKYEPGQSSTVVVYRSGAELKLSITFDAKPQQTQKPN